MSDRPVPRRRAGRTVAIVVLTIGVVNLVCLAGLSVALAAR